MLSHLSFAVQCTLLFFEIPYKSQLIKGCFLRFPTQLKKLSDRNLQASRMKYFVAVFLFALVAGIRSEYFEDLVLNDGEIPPRHPYFVGYNTVPFISSLMNIFNCSFPAFHTIHHARWLLFSCTFLFILFWGRILNGLYSLCCVD